jgi:DNA-binding NarL/FixJ family response regulator
MAVRMSIRGPETRYERVGTVVLLDEHPIWLDALERVLEDAGINVVGRTTCPETMLRLIECEGPDALVTSIELPTSPMDGVECIRRARERAPQLRIVALSTQHDAFHLASAATAGAHAYLPKTAEASELSATVLECLVSDGSRSSCARELDAAPEGPGLTGRELEILHLVARGYTNAQIAQRLWVTKWTVKFHLANAYRKLGVSNRTQAARYVFDHGIAELPFDQSVAATRRSL